MEKEAASKRKFASIEKEFLSHKKSSRAHEHSHTELLRCLKCGNTFSQPSILKKYEKYNAGQTVLLETPFNPPQLSLDTVNDDVLFLIFGYLGFDDQCSLALAYSRFCSLIADIWKKKFKCLHLNDCTDCIPFTSSNSNFRLLMEIICDTVETLDLFIDTAQWDIVRLFVYPKVKSLYLNFDFGPPSYDGNSVNISKVWPNLQWLELSSGTDYGIVLNNFKFLEEAIINNSMGMGHLENLLENHSLKSLKIINFCPKPEWISEKALTNFCVLERIYLDSSALLPSNFLRFKNLKELRINHDDEEIVDVLEAVASDMSQKLTEIYFYYFPLSLKGLPKTFENLKKVVVFDEDMSEYHEFSINGPIGCDNIREEHILEFINSSQMEYVEVNNVTRELINLQINVDEMVKNRRKQLHLNFYDQVKLNVIGSSPLLKITYLPCQYEKYIDKDYGFSFKFQ